jgi:hypothetical protein
MYYKKRFLKLYLQITKIMQGIVDDSPPNVVSITFERTKKKPQKKNNNATEKNATT